MYARTPKIETKRGLSSSPHWRVGMKAPWCEHSMDAMLEENKKEDRVKNATMVRIFTWNSNGNIVIPKYNSAYEVIAYADGRHDISHICMEYSILK
ncbi:hypothetical protein NDU88_001206 [Pleurodeles waltl]|uniref:Uncharacterized protein n=1 Tax=Pleurodeles waltl TaxID=8319 RepID=A0AAV7P307_PLEWA|nr:hypothetical protein NDU88_001206 [Pleurodeles waltl]